jgi:hypothetical protein
LFKKSYGQINYHSTFKPDSIFVNGIIETTKNLNQILENNTKNRVIIWDNGTDKVSVLVKIKSNNKVKKIKFRTDFYVDGKWEKPPVKFKHEGLCFLRLNRWQGRSKGNIPSSKSLSSKSGFDVNCEFIGNNNDTVHIIGYFEYAKK